MIIGISMGYATVLPFAVLQGEVHDNGATKIQGSITDLRPHMPLSAAMSSFSAGPAEVVTARATTLPRPARGAAFLVPDLKSRPTIGDWFA
jgi:hypothetical protein